MTGMFQSSRIASGKPRLQISSAFSPSSASTMWKSSPSRMRRATLRMTLESSTTRHVFISASISSLSPKGTFPFAASANGCPPPILGRQHVRHDFEDAIDVEHDHKLAVEAVDAAGELGHARIEVDGVLLAT